LTIIHFFLYSPRFVIAGSFITDFSLFLWQSRDKADQYHLLIIAEVIMPATDINHRPVKSWTKITLTIASQLTDITASFLAAMSPSGVEYQSDFTPDQPKLTESISIYLNKGDDAKEALAKLHLFLTDLAKSHPEHKIGTIESETIIEEDWSSNWKKHFKPVEITSRLVIKPSWEPYDPKPGQFIMELDPGMAFGTGLHASTQLSLQLIDRLFTTDSKCPETVLDVGTGTGILGMSCALLGCPKIIGLDNDIDARVAAVDNIKRNSLTDLMTVVDSDLAEIHETFDLVIANIIHNTLMEIATGLTTRVKHQGHLILAGILSGQQIDNINQHYSALGFEIIQVVSKGEWSATCLQKI